MTRRWTVVAAIFASIFLLGCAVRGMPYNGPYLTPTECRDLAALESNAPPTMGQHQSELSAQESRLRPVALV